MLRRKKGIALNQAFGAILMLVLVAVLVIIGILLFVNLISGPFANVVAASVSNESLTATTAGTSVANSTFCSFGSFSVSEVRNASGILIASGNYTVGGTGTVANLTSQVNVTTAPWSVDYGFRWGSEACTASQNMITQFGTYPTLVGLVGTIIFLGLVIGVLVASFVFGRRRDGV